MGGWLFIIFSISSIFYRISWASIINNDYYTAGVVEFRPAVSGGNSSQLLKENLSAYLQIITEANHTTDILVFPEATLNTQLQLTAVPAANLDHSLCDDNDSVEVATFLRELACAAREAQTYLVVNVKERETCLNDSKTTLCPLRGYNIYNTNVVFNRQGAIVSRYRKWNLYLEPNTNRTSQPEYAIFKTDFGVTFGHFICFDMLFYEPAQELVERLGIHDIIVTKMFNSELPFLTASQFQQGWAWGNNVNLLASGASLPTSGISGSGIYAGQQGALVRLLVGNQTVGERRLLIAQVPVWTTENVRHLFDSDLQEVTDEEPAQRDLLLLQQPQMENFTSYLVPLNGSANVSQRLCQADLCCEFELTTNVKGLRAPEYNYRIGVLVGQRTYEEAQYSVIRLCGLFACRNDSIESCGMLSENTDMEPVEFTSLRISGAFVQRRHRLLMPNSLMHSLYALQPTDMSWYREEHINGTTLIEVKLRRSQKHLLTFGIYGNYFDEYNQDEKGSGTVERVGKSLWIVLLLLLII